MAKINDITIYRGQFKDLIFTLDPVEDITGWEIEFMVRPGFGKLPIEIHKGVTLGGIIILDGPVRSFVLGSTSKTQPVSSSVITSTMFSGRM